MFSLVTTEPPSTYPLNACIWPPYYSVTIQFRCRVLFYYGIILFAWKAREASRCLPIKL